MSFESAAVVYPACAWKASASWPTWTVAHRGPIVVPASSARAAIGLLRCRSDRRALAPPDSRRVFCLPLTAGEAERRLRDALSRKFNELIFLRYRATNEAPYPFAWVDYTKPIVTTVQP